MSRVCNTKYMIIVENCGEKNHDELIYDMRFMKASSLGGIYNSLIYLDYAMLLGARVLISAEQMKDAIVGWKNYTMEEQNHRMVRQEVVVNYLPWEFNETTILRLSSTFHKYFYIKAYSESQNKDRRTLVLYRDIESDISYEHYLNAVAEGISEKVFDTIIILNEDSELEREIKKNNINLPILCMGGMNQREMLMEILKAGGYVGESSLLSVVIQIVKPQGEWKYWKILHRATENYRTDWCALSRKCLYREIAISCEYESFIGAKKSKDYHRCFALYMNKLAELYKSGITVAELLKRRGIKNVGIYGAGTVGCFLYQDLSHDETIHIEYVADKKFMSWDKIKVWELENIGAETLNCADVLIITPLFHYEDIFIELFRKGVAIPMIPMEGIVYD